jgi:hypothetical protein
MATATDRLKRPLTTRWLFVAVLFVAIFALAVRQPADTDTWWHLKSGQVMWQTGRLLRTDPFSHTVAGEPWINHGWLVQLVLWPIYHALGLGGLALMLALIVTGSFALVYIQCEGKPFVAGLVVLLAALASSIIWSIRPQIVSLLLTALVAFLLAGYKRSDNSRWLWPVPLLVVLWVNCHGGFVIAFILMGCYFLGELLNRFAGTQPANARLRPLFFILLLSIPAILLNPNTVKMIPYAFQTVSIGPLQDYIQEWAAPNFHNLQQQPFIWLLLLTLVTMGLSRSRADWTDLVLVTAFGYMAFLAVRNIALFALVVPPVLARHAVVAIADLSESNRRLSWLGVLTRRESPQPRRSHALLNLLLLILLLGGAGLKVAVDLIDIQDPDVWGRGLPLGAVAYLQQHDTPGNMLNTYNWGGYLIWSLYPDRPVFIDGRTDLYALNSRVLEDYVKIHWIRPGWSQVLTDYDIGYVLTEQMGLLDVAMSGASGWERVYQDDLAVVYFQSEGSP